MRIARYTVILTLGVSLHAVTVLAQGVPNRRPGADSTPRTADSLVLFIPPALLGIPIVAPGPLIFLGERPPLSPGSVVRLPTPPPPTSTARAPGLRDSASTRTTKLFGDFADLGLVLDARLEMKGERTRNERCNASQLFDPFASCRGALQPDLGVQFALRSTGTVGDKTHVNVDYDSKREFDASNTISVFYDATPPPTATASTVAVQGDSGRMPGVGVPSERGPGFLQRLELGNVSFTPPPSRYITASIPSGNYGGIAVAQLGPLRLRAIAAQQKGNVVQSRQFTIGEHTLRGNERELEDYQIEPRRFFFTVDPALFRGEYPNIDILDRAQMDRMRRALPDTLRPTRVAVYRLQFGTQPRDPNGPSFYLLGGSASGVPTAGRQTYDLLRAGVDYYVDQSNLWVALVRPLNPNNERLVVAFSVRLAGGARDTVWRTTGGTPDLSARPDSQFAALVWDPRALPGTPAFRQEIRSVYRIAGEDLQRESTELRIVAGSADQEQPTAGGGGATYLEMFGLAQRNNSADFDVESRLWPRPGDAVYDLTSGAGDARAPALPGVPSAPLQGGAFAGVATSPRIFRDNYLVFPSLTPFAGRGSGGGLVSPGNPTNEAIYSTPGEYLYSPQHPASVYRIRVSYDASGAGDAGVLDLGSVQIRRGSERIEVDGRALTREIDYRVDYEAGRVTFLRPDTLFRTQRQVTARFEENPLFAPAPTSMYGLTSELPLPHGQINFTALSQSQRTTFTRPQLGFEPVSALLAGVTGQFSWNAPFFSRALSKLSLPFTSGFAANAPSKFAIQGELAASRPRPGSAGEAFVESFEGEGGLPIDLTDTRWYFGSIPAVAHNRLPLVPDTANAVAFAWQTNGTYLNGDRASFGSSDIDPRVAVAGLGFSIPETLLWLTLYPDTIGRLSLRSSNADWVTPGPRGAAGRRWRSIRTSLSTTGLDLSQSDYLEFWAFIDTTTTFRARNPTLVLDLGDLSEASLAFAPETLYVSRTGTDSVYRGRRAQGLDSFDSERDPFSHAFSTGANDRGLPGDRIDHLVVVDSSSDAVPLPRQVNDVTICRSFFNALLHLGDVRADCTAGNNHLDEEDLDLDNTLNLTSAQREQEHIRRYVVDLSDTSLYTRIGGEFTWNDSQGSRRKQWVLIRVPLATPTDSLGDVTLRRVRSLRLTMISAPPLGFDDFTQIAIAKLKFGGAPWVKRSDVTLSGVGGERSGGGFVLTSLIGTNDLDSLRGVFYEPPPGFENQILSRNEQLTPGIVQINERSLRVRAGNLPRAHRAEAFYRFPGGPQNFMTYEELRLWARGRGHGWAQPGGARGELQMFVKIGRDENNFYLFHSPVNAGPSRDDWNPELHIELRRFYDLRQRIENAFLRGTADTLSCGGIDAELVAATAIVGTGAIRRFAACDGEGYMVYTTDPGITPPNLAAVQEMSVGIVRVDDPAAGSATATTPADTLELWVDEIRLSRPVRNTGVASQFGVNFTAGDFADLRVDFTRKDPHFRQLAEQPSFVDEQALSFAGTFKLEKLLPGARGFSLPLTVVRSSSGYDPLFLARSDIAAGGIEGLRAPRSGSTSYSLSLRRTTPLSNPILGALVNNLSATSTYVDGGSRSEYQSASRRGFDFSVDYRVADSARTLGLLRWNPSLFRLTSGMSRASERRLSFASPLTFTDDQSLSTLAATNLWRGGGLLELRPFKGLNARWELNSVRDLRKYGDTSAAALIAGAERERLLGMDGGFERERTVQTGLTLAPAFSAWFRPRAELGTQYSMLRDPNARVLTPRPGVIGVDSLLAQLDSVRLARPDSIVSTLTLPRRVAASQIASTGLTFDFGRLVAAHIPDSNRTSRLRRLGRAIAPLDVSITRTLLSVFDAAAFRPPSGFQLGFGGPAAFRSVSDNPASTAGATTTLLASGSFNLPFGTSLTNRFRRTVTDNWALGLDGLQSRIDGAQTVFPDAALRFALRPLSTRSPITALTASVGYSEASAVSTLPIGIDPANPDLELRERRTSHVRSFPLTTSIAWGFGGLSTAAGYTLTRRVDSLAGSLTHSNSAELNVDVGRSFRLPRRLGLPSDIRTRVNYQRSASQVDVFDLAGGPASRLGDQGRSAFSLNADTDISQGLLFTLQGSRVVTFDNNLNRRVNQFVLSTVLQIQFYSGQIR